MKILALEMFDQTGADKTLKKEGNLRLGKVEQISTKLSYVASQSISLGQKMQGASDIVPVQTRPPKDRPSTQSVIRAFVNDKVEGVKNWIENRKFVEFVERATTNCPDPKDPRSLTPVFDWSKEGGFNRVGDLTNIPEATKEQMGKGKMTVCPRPLLLEKAPAGNYEPRGAVVVGIRDNPDICRELHFTKLRERIDEYKKAKAEEK